MLTFRVEKPYFPYDPKTGWVANEPSWADSGLTFPSPYSAAQYAKECFGRVVDEETGAEPAHGGVIDEETWEMKKGWLKKGLRCVVPVDMGILELEY